VPAAAEDWRFPRRAQTGTISESMIQAFILSSKMNIGMMLFASTAVHASSLLLIKAVSTFK
jgi:hypothetical protein